MNWIVKCDPWLNSGIQVRSHVYGKDDPDPQNQRRAGVVYGPQCEIARKETGTAGRFYDEGRRGKWLAEIRPEAQDAFRDDGWNRYRIVVQGNRYRSWVNGVAASDFTDDVDKGGFIGLQVHGISKGEGPYQVRWRNIRIKELKPGDDASASIGRWPAMWRRRSGGLTTTSKTTAATSTWSFGMDHLGRDATGCPGLHRIVATSRSRAVAARSSGIEVPVDRRHSSGRGILGPGAPRGTKGSDRTRRGSVWP